MELAGSYCKDCKVFNDDVEESAVRLIYNILSQPEMSEAKIRIMPDVHSGKGIVIGFTSPFSDYVNPDHVGCDIGCTVSSYFYNTIVPVDLYPELEKQIKESIPFGQSIHESSKVSFNQWIKFLKQEANKVLSSGINIKINTEKDLEAWCRKIGIGTKVFWNSIGTVGGGNHYIEYGEDDKGSCAITIHSGSRNLGQKVWKYWRRVADGSCISKEGERKIINEVKERNQDRNKLSEEIKSALTDYRLSLHPGYLSGENLREYLEDMTIAQAYAKFSHKVMHEIIEKIYNKLIHGKRTSEIFTHHNYIDLESRIIRKGAVSAKLGEMFLLPLNMRDGMAVCIGKGNEDWNNSCSHGAGRVKSRSAAKEEISMKDFIDSMKGVYSTSICESTLDESPQAYKDSSTILKLIKPSAEVKTLLRPKINIKSSIEFKNK